MLQINLNFIEYNVLFIVLFIFWYFVSLLGFVCVQYPFYLAIIIFCNSSLSKSNCLTHWTRSQYDTLYIFSKLLFLIAATGPVYTRYGASGCSVTAAVVYKG